MRPSGKAGHKHHSLSIVRKQFVHIVQQSICNSLSEYSQVYINLRTSIIFRRAKGCVQRFTNLVDIQLLFLCPLKNFHSRHFFINFTAALQSVFPQTELGTFMSLIKRDKERQLNELTLIVTGIRLFNRECGKGGEGIDDCKLK